MHFVDLAEVHPFGFVIKDFKTIFHDPFRYLVDALLHFIRTGGWVNWIRILNFAFQLGWRVGHCSQYCHWWILLCSFLLWFWLSWIDCNSFGGLYLSKVFCDWVSYMFFTWGFCVSLRNVNVFIWYFLYKVPNYFWIGIGVYFWGESSPRRSFGFFDAMLSFGSLLFVVI